MNQKNPKVLNPLIEELQSYIQDKDKRNHRVTKVDVAWHLDHSLKVINGISRQLLASEPSKYKSNFNLSRSVLFALGFIPRGKGKAPKVVLPPEIILVDDIKSQIKLAKALIVELEDLPVNANFKHSIFGNLNKSQTIRFLEVHTKHHLKIIRETLKG